MDLTAIVLAVISGMVGAIGKFILDRSYSHFLKNL